MQRKEESRPEYELILMKIADPNSSLLFSRRLRANEKSLCIYYKGYNVTLRARTPDKISRYPKHVDRYEKWRYTP